MFLWVVNHQIHPPGHVRQPADDQDYLRASLENPDPLQANLGAINSDLMRIAYRLLKVTDAACAKAANPLNAFGTLVPAIETCYKVTHQIQRFAELDRRMRKPQDGKQVPLPGE